MLSNPLPEDVVVDDDGVLHHGRVPLPHRCGALNVRAHQRDFTPANTRVCITAEFHSHIDVEPSTSVHTSVTSLLQTQGLHPGVQLSRRLGAANICAHQRHAHH
jgi:hypothetical protein